MEALIESCFESGFGPGPLSPEPGSKRSIRGGITPHAGINVSGPVAAHTYHAIYADGIPETFVIIGPSHRSSGPPVASTSEDFIMPSGVCEVDRDLLDALDGAVTEDPMTHIYEHSLEVQVPFIQRIAPEARIVPLAMNDQGPQTAQMLGEALGEACSGRDVVILASTDLTHYESPESARAKDSKVIRAIESLEPMAVWEAVMSDRVSMCGPGPVMSMMYAVGPSSCDVLCYSNSGEILGSGSEVVGYLSAVLR